MSLKESVDWEQISSTHFVFEEGCWNSACQSLCCRASVPGANFRIIKERGVYLLYLSGEYEYHQKEKTLPLASGEESKFRTWKLDFGRSTCLEVVLASCWFEGRCVEPAKKPLVCKLYPFLPILDLDGNLEELYLLNLFDLTIEARGFEKRCNILELRAKYFDLWRNNTKALTTLQHPFFIFHFRAAKIFLENYLDELSKNEKLRGKQGKEFWDCWEIEYLTGRLLNQDAIRPKVANLYDLVIQKYGELALCHQT